MWPLQFIDDFFPHFWIDFVDFLLQFAFKVGRPLRIPFTKQFNLSEKGEITGSEQINSNILYFHIVTRH